MKQLFLLLLLPALLWADNTSTPTKPYTFISGATISSSQVNSDFDTLYTGLANVGTANLLDSSLSTAKYIDASITTAKLDATAQAKLIPSGTILDYVGSSAPTGFVMMDGKTIGDATSGADHANSDSSVIFILIYGSMTNTEAPVSGGRTGNAATDFGNHKKLTLPDLRGRVVAGIDYDNGGGLASRITVAGGNFDGSVNGKAGGAQNHTLITAELAAHTHTIGSTSHQHAFEQSSGFQAGASATAVIPIGGGGGTALSTLVNGAASATGSNGSGTAHTVLSPVMVLYKIIKL